MEILRHNAISDKPNAFNKLLNLFVCKIIDEDKNPEDELDFQWRESDTDESLQLRLNDLYKEGMWRFLEIQVIDYSQDDVAQKLASLDPTTKQWIMEMYTNTRLKKSPNFAFVEVQDERTFALNAKVVREIVELLQIYKFRYAQRHEFLGNFFELLLNTSMKQEAGQYFTPVPITRFILSSLPFRNWFRIELMRATVSLCLLLLTMLAVADTFLLSICLRCRISLIPAQSTYVVPHLPLEVSFRFGRVSSSFSGQKIQFMELIWTTVLSRQPRSVPFLMAMGKQILSGPTAWIISPKAKHTGTS